KWVKDSEITMAAFEDYYRGRPYLDRVVARIIHEPATREMEFESGGLDMYVLTDPQYARLKDDPTAGDYLIEVPELFLRHIGFHTQKSPFDDVRVRQAINYAIDRHVIIEQVLHGKAYPAMGWFPPTNPAYNPDIENHAYTYDPERALELLDEAGLADGFTSTCLTTDHPAWGLPALEAAMGYLEEVNITVIPELQEGAVVLARAYEGDYEMYIHSFGIAHPLDLRRRSHTNLWGAAGNTFRYSNEEVDSLVDRAVRSVDRDEMLELLREAELIILREAPTWFFNYNKAVMLHQSWVHGLVANPSDMDYQFLERVWLSRD
ncbi:MAG: ABC transporter substrate-binding protein, partial [Bacillota bacterium]